MGTARWRWFFAVTLLAVAGLSVYTVFTIRSVSADIESAITELRRFHVGQLSRTWTSGGNAITYTATQKDGETFAQFVSRFESELATLQDDEHFPPDS